MMLKALIVEQLEVDGTLRTFQMQPSAEGRDIVVAFADEYEENRSGPFHFLDKDDARRFDEGFGQCRVRKVGKSYFSLNGHAYHFEGKWSGIPTERNWLSYYAPSLPEFAIPVSLSVTDPHRLETEYKRAIRRDGTRHRAEKFGRDVRGSCRKVATAIAARPAPAGRYTQIHTPTTTVLNVSSLSVASDFPEGRFWTVKH